MAADAAAGAESAPRNGPEATELVNALLDSYRFVNSMGEQIFGVRVT